MSPSTTKLPKLLWLLPCCLAGGWFGLATLEWIRVGVIADPAVLSQYPFGSTEGPVGGAAHYASAQAYALHSLKSALLAGSCAALFAVAGARNSRAVLAAGFVVSLVLVAVASNAL
jgi:hypothetical protein